MSIYRGLGGSSDNINDATISAVATYVVSAATSATNSAESASNAETSKILSENFSIVATAQAGIATAQAVEATAQAVEATAQAVEATAQATNAATSAAAALTSADIAATAATYLPAGTGAVVTTVQAALRDAAKLYTAMPRSTSEPAEDFDRPEGTLLNGITTVSGHVLTATATGAATLQVQNGGASATSNTYMGLTSGTLVTRVSGVFSYAPSGTGQAVIMFNGGPTPNSLDKLVHLEVTSTNILIKMTVTGAANLTPWVGTVRERTGRINAGYFLIPLPRDFTPCHISMEYTQGATDLDDILAVHMPDGRILEHTGDARLRQVMSTCYHGTWQLTGTAARWHNIALNQTRQQFRDVLVRNSSLRQVVPLADTARFYIRNRSTVVYPTATGWYKVIDQVSESGAFSGLVGTVRIYGRDNAGRLDYIELFLNSYQSVANTITPIKYGYGPFSGTHINRVRLSYNSGTGARQLEINVNTFSSASDFVVVEFDGAGSMVANPVVGSTALTFSREQAVNNLSLGHRTDPAVTTKTFTPGIDQQKNILINHYAGAVDFFVDDTKANAGDEFYFARAAGWSQSAVIKNTSDSSTVTTLAPGQSAWLGVISGKFATYAKGTI